MTVFYFLTEDKLYRAPQLLLSVVLDVVEFPGACYPLQQFMPVLDVTGIVGDAAVEDVLQGVLPQKQVAENTHLSGVTTAQPQLPQVFDGVYATLSMTELADYFVVAVFVSLAEFVDFDFVLFDEGNDGLAVVLGNIFCLVLRWLPLEISLCDGASEQR